MKWLGQYIQDLTARFRHEVYLENISSGTIVSGGNLGLDSNNKIVKATVGGGTKLFTQRECLRLMECEGSGKADKLAEIIAATVLAGEFPTAAAVVNKTYVDAYRKYANRKK